jgi:peptidoglycan/LPS O-acetylase OafA/YrhL
VALTVGNHSPVLADVFLPRSNAIGALRLAFALLVVVSHSWPLGLGRADPLTVFSHGQTDAGAVAVAGFFVLSGFLVTRSARRTSLGRFAWHRALRILPAFWVCLLLMALVLGPVLWWVREDTLAGYASARPGPLGFVTANWFTAMGQWGIGDLLTTTPYGRFKDLSILNGSLWTLRYELFCYVVMGLLAALGVARRRPTVLVGLAGVLYGMVVLDWLNNDRFAGARTSLPDIGGLPLLGNLSGGPLFAFGLMFAIGAVAAVRPDRFPVSDRLAAAAAVVILVTLRFGGWDVAGAPAFAYVVLWAAIRLPRPVHRVGARHDVSYGVYLYAFPIQQVLALLDVARTGTATFIALSVAGSLVAGWLSWHAVERPALALRHATWGLWRERRPGPRHAAAGASGRIYAKPAPTVLAAVARPRQRPRRGGPEARDRLVPHQLDRRAAVPAPSPAADAHPGLLHHAAAGDVVGERLGLHPRYADLVEQIPEQRVQGLGRVPEVPAGLGDRVADVRGLGELVDPAADLPHQREVRAADDEERADVVR